ncbi:MAG: hypothetical protein KIT62_07635 [Cyclobacteriaceae bacterium]|nr:hypothetical protein [Cyclobacteriaceae bacterium]
MVRILYVLSFLFVVASAQAQPEPPFKSETEFEFKLDYSFKERAPQEKSDYEAYDPGKKKPSTGPLPYLKTELLLLTLAPQEVRLKVINKKGTTILNRKATTATVIKIDWGFSDDVKDQIVSNSYTILLQNEKKETVTRIILLAEADGTFLVNGQKRGRL